MERSSESRINTSFRKGCLDIGSEKVSTIKKE